MYNTIRRNLLNKMTTDILHHLYKLESPPEIMSEDFFFL